MRCMLSTPFVVCTLLPAQTPGELKTAAEASGHTVTSSAGDVQKFCEAVLKLPHGNRLTMRVAGRTTQDRAQLLVKVALPPDPGRQRVRALVIGSIHAGEVEGKEALQVLLRELASGEHENLLQRCELWFLPIYNVDGNEAVGPKNRPGQNGPEITGQRSNGKGLDLNRDFVKLDAPETQTLVGLFGEIDPHLFVDLHTTNGSYHGYHLTYSPSLSPNVDPGIAQLSRAMLDAATAAMKDQEFATFDYGNFETRDWDGGGAPESPKVRGWYTYDHRARYGVNYFGLRNRIGILSEAYSYCDFSTRIAATRAFVLCLLDGLARRADEVLAACAAADRRLVEPQQPASFGFDTTFGEVEKLPVLVGEVERIEATGEGTHRFVRKGDGVPETMPVCRSFRARQQLALPQAWAIAAPTPDVVDRLQRHGIRFQQLDAGRVVAAERFAVTAKRKPKRPYQGHQELALDGQWQPAAPVELVKGAIVITSRQPLARLAAQLLEPQSEDSLSSWNFFEAQTADFYPVLRLVE